MSNSQTGMNDWRSRQRRDQLQFYADTLMGLRNEFNKQFGDWMFKEVLPEIRRAGKYTGCEPPSIALLGTVLSFSDDPDLNPPTSYSA